MISSRISATHSYENGAYPPLSHTNAISVMVDEAVLTQCFYQKIASNGSTACTTLDPPKRLLEISNIIVKADPKGKMLTILTNANDRKLMY